MLVRNGEQRWVIIIKITQWNYIKYSGNHKAWNSSPGEDSVVWVLTCGSSTRGSGITVKGLRTHWKDHCCLNNLSRPLKAVTRWIHVAFSHMHFLYRRLQDFLLFFSFQVLTGKVRIYWSRRQIVPFAGGAGVGMRAKFTTLRRSVSRKTGKRIFLWDCSGKGLSKHRTHFSLNRWPGLPSGQPMPLPAFSPSPFNGRYFWWHNKKHDFNFEPWWNRLKNAMYINY